MNKTKKALASLAIAGMALTMVPFNVFATGTVPTRLAGITAEQTAVAIADQTGYTATAILASSAAYGAADALTSGPLAAFLKAPILLQGPGTVLNADTKTELTKLAIKKVYVTSGTAVISQAVLTELTGMGIAVESLGGNDRFDTSVNIAKKLVALGAPVKKVAVAYGWLNQDALSIASIASATVSPIILTEKAGLPASAKAFLAANLGITASDVIGGTGVIDASVLTQLPNATRHFGNTAYDTNNQVIQDFASSLAFDQVYLANGVTGIDALSGAPLAAQTKSAIVLTDGVNDPAAGVFVKGKMTTSSAVTALGGTAVVPEIQRVNFGVVTPSVEVQAATAAVVKAEASKLSADVVSAKALVNALVADVAPATTKADLLARLKSVTAPVISDVSFKVTTTTGSAITTGAAITAEIGDTMTLTFTTDQPITKLGSFRVNGSNPDTFTNVGNVYTATHLVDIGDPKGTASFQINVQNAKGVYSTTVETTTDGSGITVAP